MNPANRKSTPRSNPVAAGRAPQSSPSATLAPGTLCFLTRVGNPEGLNGRVVEVVAGPREEFGTGPGPFYDIRAQWLAERFPERDCVAQRQQLIPITPDEPAQGDLDLADTSFESRLDLFRDRMVEINQFLARIK